MSKRHAFWILVAVCLLAYVLRVLYLDGQSLWRDEVDAIRFANRPVDLLLGTFRTPGENGPLYYLLLRPWLVLAGLSEFSLRFFSLFFGVLAVPLTYRLCCPGSQPCATVHRLCILFCRGVRGKCGRYGVSGPGH